MRLLLLVLGLVHSEFVKELVDLLIREVVLVPGYVARLRILPNLLQFVDVQQTLILQIIII